MLVQCCYLTINRMRAHSKQSQKIISMYSCLICLDDFQYRRMQPKRHTSTRHTPPYNRRNPNQTSRGDALVPNVPKDHVITHVFNDSSLMLKTHQSVSIEPNKPDMLEILNLDSQTRYVGDPQPRLLEVGGISFSSRPEMLFLLLIASWIGLSETPTTGTPRGWSSLAAAVADLR